MMKSGLCFSLVLLIFAACGPAPDEGPLFRPDLEGVGPLRIKKLEQAEEQVRLARKGTSKTEWAKAYGNLGMYYQAYRLDSGALFYFKLAAEAEPKNYVWPYYEARSLRNLSQIDEAYQRFLDVYRLAPDHLPTLIELGEFLRRRNQLEQAAPYFEKALAIDRDCVAAMVGLAQIAEMHKDHQRALDLASEALKRQPEVGLIHFVAGMAWRGLGDLEKAEQHLQLQETYKKGIYIKDDLMRQVFLLAADGKQAYKAGKQALEAGNPEEAVSHFAEAVASEPNTVEYRMDLAWSQLLAGRKEDALASYLEVLPNRPGNPNILYNIGGILLEQGRPGEALPYFEQMVQLDPQNFSAYRHLADIQRNLGAFEQSLGFYKKMVEIQPQNPEGRLGRALMLLRLHRNLEARDALVEDIATLPGQPAFVQALIRVLTGSSEKKVRDGKKAERLLQDLLKLEPDTEICETAAMTYAELGQFDQAIFWQKKAIALAEPDVDDWMTQTLADYSQGRARRVPWPDDHPLFRMPTYGR